MVQEIGYFGSEKAAVLYMIVTVFTHLELFSIAY